MVKEGDEEKNRKHGAESGKKKKKGGEKKNEGKEERSGETERGGWLAIEV